MTVNTAKDFPVQVIAEYGIPQSFLSYSADQRCCIFMISCHSRQKFHEMGYSTKAITGYTPEQFQKGGMPFWFSLIHPEDMSLVSGKIIEGHTNLTTPFRDGQEAVPLLLNYRMKHADGRYIRVRDSRYLLSCSGDKVIDNILCRMELIDNAGPENTGITDLLQKEKSCNHMLEAAVLHQASQKKEVLPGNTEQDSSVIAPRLTAREKEILRLIADGLSSKMIADQCCISINTVETHRRHLLEKLGAKNSMELIKEASKVFVL